MHAHSATALTSRSSRCSVHRVRRARVARHPGVRPQPVHPALQGGREHAEGAREIGRESGARGRSLTHVPRPTHLSRDPTFPRDPTFFPYLQATFWFRKHMAPPAEGECEGGDCDACEEMTAAEILTGKVRRRRRPPRRLHQTRSVPHAPRPAAAIRAPTSPGCSLSPTRTSKPSTAIRRRRR